MKKVISALLVCILLLSAIAMMSSAERKSSIGEARKYAEKSLLPLEGIVGISNTKEKIIVYIEDIGDKGKVPDEIKGFKTEVKVIGRIEALSMAGTESLPFYTYGTVVNRTGEVRPISGGISCGVPEDAFGGEMAGTLGIVTNNSYILSCAHVLVMDKDANFLPIDTPLQPGTYDGGTTADEVGI